MVQKERSGAWCDSHRDRAQQIDVLLTNLFPIQVHINKEKVVQAVLGEKVVQHLVSSDVEEEEGEGLEGLRLHEGAGLTGLVGGWVGGWVS